MARINPKNKRFRTRQQMAADISVALRSELTYGGKFDVLSAVMWAWTEYAGKYLGCRYWTKLAIGTYQRDHNIRNLRHEHVVPKRCVMAMLFSLADATPDVVYALLSRYLIGVIVTREEDAILAVEHSQSMPDEFESCADVMAREPWLRYQRCNIEWIDVRSLP